MSQSEDKSARLAAALRANLGRRKAQARARRETPESDSPAGTAPAAAPPAPDTGRDLGVAREGGSEGGSGHSEIVPAGKPR